MLHFFRKIRKGFLSDHKFSKYLLYAVGEIVLVVIGILIALQINNKNEERKDGLKAESYMNRIHEDVERSIKLSENQSQLNRKILNSISETQKYLVRGTILSPEEKETVDYAFLWFSRTTYQLPTILTYEEMKESGNLHLIKDIQLRNELAGYYSYLNQVTSIYEKISEDIERQFIVINTHLRATTNPETLDISFNYEFEEMCNDPIFINTFSRISVHWRGLVYFMERVNKTSKELQLEVEKVKD